MPRTEATSQKKPRDGLKVEVFEDPALSLEMIVAEIAQIMG
jgi:hypothetical protein